MSQRQICKVIERKDPTCKIENKSKPSIIYQNLFMKENGVQELVFKDFHIQNKRITVKNKNFQHRGFILFYAPWCSHCKKFQQEYENLSREYFQLFPFGAVNVENSKDGNDRLRLFANVVNIPTLMIIQKDGSLEKFNGRISYDDLMYYIQMNL